MTYAIHVTDPPIRLRKGESFIGHRVIIGAATYGRVLFTIASALECEGENYIANCEFIAYGKGAA